MKARPRTRTAAPLPLDSFELQFRFIIATAVLIFTMVAMPTPVPADFADVSLPQASYSAGLQDGTLVASLAFLPESLAETTASAALATIDISADSVSVLAGQVVEVNWAFASVLSAAAGLAGF